MRRPTVALVVAAALASACSGGFDTPSPWHCDATHQTGCAAGQYCELVGASGSSCFSPVLVRGTVVDPAGAGSLAGARVVALDPNRAPASTVATTSAAGAYELAVRATRDPSGKPVSGSVTLRADAQGYETFPGGIRPALPIDLSTAVSAGGRWVVSGPLTALELLPLQGSAWSAVHGTVARPPSGAAPLVVAEPVGGGPAVTGIANLDGSYAIFNLTPGASYVVTPYAQGVNYSSSPATGSLDPWADATVQALAIAGTAGVSFGGNIIQNNSPSPDFQVTLVVDSTYVTTLDRGESPPGLTVSGSFANPGYTFTGVPDGTFRVLAAFGLDGDVRDVSGTGNTASPRITVSGGALVGSPPGFKIIPAVALQSIGGVTVGADPVVVVSTATPVFAWTTRSSYSSAATFRVLVFDALGNMAWTRDVSSDAPIAYGSGGSAAATLVPGRPYQLRVVAIAEAIPVPASFTQLSQTEDLLGVFTYRPSP